VGLSRGAGGGHSPAVTSTPAIVELRQYTLLPGKRDELIDLFEAKFIESQEACGMTVIGIFRDLDDDDRFVWLRGFPDMAARAQSLASFYYGPVWQRHRDAAVSTMVDSDDVLLLRPAQSKNGFRLNGERPGPAASAHGERGLVEATILSLAAPLRDGELAYFEEVIAPRIAEAGSLLGVLVTEYSPNNFPALPVREGEHALVWLAAYRDRAAYDAAHDHRAEIERAAVGMSRLAAGPRVLRLAPTRRSPLTGSAPVQSR
jgi:quinol monooxygenase YgiN